MLLGLGVFLGGQKWLYGAGDPSVRQAVDRRFLPGSPAEAMVYLGALAAVVVAWQLVQNNQLVGAMLSGLGIVVLAAIVGYLVLKCDPIERDQLFVALVLIGLSMVFWAFFEQAGSSVNLFTDRNVDRTVNGREIKASLFQSVNPGFILLLGPVFSALWVAMARRRIEPSTPVKFGLGIVQLGLGFGVLWLGAKSAGSDGIVALGWLLLGYFLHTTGELCLSPVGLSMITKLSPVRIVGLMMGTWFLATAFSQYVAGLIAAMTGVEGTGEGEGPLPPPSETVMVYGNVFGGIAVTAIVAGLAALAISPWLRKRMHGVH
jgi:POT family proton-dependent oligopeptide transporter